MGLRADLNLDVGGAGGAFLTQVSGPTTALTGLSVPTIPAATMGRLGAAGSIDIGPLTGAVEGLLGQIPSVAGIDLGDILGRLGEIVARLATLTESDPRAGIEAAIADLTAELRGARDGQFGLILRLVELVRTRPEAALLGDLLMPLLRGTGLDQLSFPFADVVPAAGGLIRALGGMMALETTLAEAERLARAALPLIDADRLRERLAEFEDALPGQVALIDAAGPGDPGAVQGAAQLAVALAAQLEAVREPAAAGFGMVEATVVYLDLGRLQAEVDLARGWLRTADLAATERVVAALAELVIPLVPPSLDRIPPASLDGLLDLAESEVAALAGSISGIDLAILLDPLQSGIDAIARPLREVDALIGEVVAGVQRALATVADAVRALPLDDLAAAIGRVTAPIADVVRAATDLVEDIQQALDDAAETVDTALGQIEGALDTLKTAVDTLFGGAREALAAANIDGALGEVADNIAAFAELLAGAQLKPVFDTTVDAIDATTDVVSAVPFGLLPESMKSEVDAAVRPIKQTDVDAAAARIETALAITPDGRFAFRDDIEAAIADITLQFRALLDEVVANAPRAALAEVGERIDDLADLVRGIEPAMTLEPVRAALDEVRAVIAGIDIESALQPLYDAFDTMLAGLDALSGEALLGPLLTQVDAVRTAVIEQTRIASWGEALDGLQAEAQRLLAFADPARLAPAVEAGLAELQALADRGPAVAPSAGIGHIVAMLAQNEGLRIDPATYPAVQIWIGESGGAAALTARTAALSQAFTRLLAQVDSADIAVAFQPLLAPLAAVRAALERLATRLPADDPARLSIEAAAARLDAGAIAADLAVNRERLRALLAAAAGLAEGFRANGFPEVDAAAARVAGAFAPARPLGTTLRRVLAGIGLAPELLSLGEVVRTLLASAPPARLVGMVTPLLGALHERLDALLAGVITPARTAIADLQALIDAIDLAPLTEAVDGAVEAVEEELAPLHPRALLAGPVGAITGLRDALVTADPLAPIIDILDDLRAAILRVLAKLDLELLLETPLAIYDEIVAILGRLDPGPLLDPVLDLLDSIASDVDTGLDEVVVSFKALQDALPSGGGGSSASASVSVGA